MEKIPKEKKGGEMFEGLIEDKRTGPSAFEIYCRGWIFRYTVDQHNNLSKPTRINFAHGPALSDEQYEAVRNRADTLRWMIEHERSTKAERDAHMKKPEEPEQLDLFKP